MPRFPSPAPTEAEDSYARERQTDFRACWHLWTPPLLSLVQPRVMDFLWLSEGRSFQSLLHTGFQCMCFWAGISAGNPFPDKVRWGYLGCGSPARNGGAGRAGQG